jgi:tetratricopeptide (TPR) repeat protein
MIRPLWIISALIALLLVGCESDLARRISAYEKTRDYDAAQALLERAVQQQPRNAEAQYYLGRLYLRDGNYEAGREALTASQEASPRFVKRSEFLLEKYMRQEMTAGMQAFEANQLDAAIQHFRWAAQIQPAAPATHRALGHALVESEQPTAAESAYRQALSLESDNVETLNNLAELTFRRGAYEQAVNYSRQALEVQDTPQREVVERLAYAYVALGDFASAEPHFQRVLTLTNDAQVRADYALVLFNQEKYQAARPRLEALAQREDAGSKIVRALAETYYALDRYMQSITWYERLLERVPDDRNALQNLVMAYERTEQFGDAQTYRDQLRRLEDSSE